MTDAPRPGRTIGRSTTKAASNGREVGLENPIDRGYLCEKLCTCNAGTAILSRAGQQLKQRCVSARIWKDEEDNQLVWRYKAEVGFNMKTNPPAPLMSRDQPNRPSRFPLGRAMGDGILKRDMEGRPQRGLLRIPDCIILKVTGAELAAMRASSNIDWRRLIPIGPNIERVVEIKFDGDSLTEEQREDYSNIAGPERFRLVKISDCDCSRKRPEPTNEPVRVPVTTPMKQESTEARRWYQLTSSQPRLIPAPQPIRPQYGPVVSQEEGSSLSSWLKAAALTAGVMLVGAIVISAAPVEAVAAGVALLVVGGTANATPSKKKDK